MSTRQAAEYIDMSISFLERDRFSGKVNGSGPLIPYRRVGNRAVRYAKADLDAFLEARLNHKA